MNPKSIGEKVKKRTGFSFSVEDYILYILNKLEPDKSDKIRLNKIAFFAEFAYLYFKGQPLSDARYAAIDNGPVINNYKEVLARMDKEGKITMDGYKIRPLGSPAPEIPEEV